VTLVGAGPGDPEFADHQGAAAAPGRTPTSFFTMKLVSPEILDRGPPRCFAAYRWARRVGKPGIGQDAINRLVDRGGPNQASARVRLKGGDPFVFGRGGEEVEALRGGRRRLFGGSGELTRRPWCRRRNSKCRSLFGTRRLPHHLPHRTQGKRR